MAPDELSLACRLSGLPLDDLWLRYLEIGGSRSRMELASRLGGAAWPEPEDRYLAVVADEALRESGVPRLTPPGVPLGPLLGEGVLGDEDEGGPCRAAATELATRVLGTQLTRLFERCARTRATARGVRQYAQSVRRAGPFRGQPSPGGC